jgi:hypothetical protein
VRVLILLVTSNAYSHYVHLSLFGKPGSQYDFNAVDVAGLKEKARELEQQQRGMKKKVNPKVINMIDR